MVQPVKQLHVPHGKHRYCGPTALSAITGISKDDIARMAREVGGRSQIKGMSNLEALGVIKKLGGTVAPVPLKSGATLQRWMDTRNTAHFRGLLLVNVTDHYVAVLGDTVVCSLQKGEARDIKDARCRLKRVKRAWLVELPARVELPKSTILAKKAATRRSTVGTRERMEARKLAATLGLAVEHYERDVYDLVIVDEARYRKVLAPHGPVDDGQDLTSTLTELVDSLACYGWGEVKQRLLEIQGELFHQAA